MKRPIILGLSAIVACVGLSQINSASAIIPEVVGATFQRTPSQTFENDGSPSDTLDRILSRGDAEKVLTRIATDGNADPAARGWAILGLTRVSADTTLTLEQLRDDGANSMLVRTWAASARVKRSKDLPDLVTQAPLVGQYPGLDRPFKQAVMRHLEGTHDLEDLIQVAASFPQLSVEISQSIVAAETRDLVALIYRGKDNNIRRQAAAYAAAKAQQGDAEEVGAALIGALTFRGGTPPWAGNALFIPNIGWTGPQGQALIGELIRWSVHCADNPELVGERQQIWNNLTSVGLLHTAGYNGSLPSDPVGMVQRYGQVMGKSAMRDLLRDLDLSEDARFAKLSSR